MATLFLVSCVGMKRPSSAAACDLYTSPWFRKARAYVESTGEPWAILSAEYGVLPPDVVVPPYERTLNTMSAAERRAWSERVVRELEDLVQPGDRVVVLAGRRYREHVAPELERRGVAVEVPLAGLGIGQQLHALGEMGP